MRASVDSVRRHAEPDWFHDAKWVMPRAKYLPFWLTCCRRRICPYAYRMYSRGDWSRESGRNLMRAALDAHPDIRAACTACDPMALGALDAVIETGHTDQILIAGFDAIPDALVELSAGRIMATAYQKPHRMGSMAVDIACQATRGHTVPGRADIEVELITTDNVTAYQQQRRRPDEAPPSIRSCATRTSTNPSSGYSPLTAVHRSVKAEVLSLRSIHSTRFSVSSDGANPSLNSS
jgi:substrate-binding family protein